VNIDVKNPQESIFVKDALNEAIYTLFDSNIKKSNYNSVINLDILSSKLEPLDFDENGYPILYRSKVVLKANIIDKNGKRRVYTIKGIYDFHISSNSVVNDQLRLTAFKKASINALNKLMALIAKDGIDESK
jgi:hypothetical protein